MRWVCSYVGWVEFSVKRSPLWWYSAGASNVTGTDVLAERLAFLICARDSFSLVLAQVRRQSLVPAIVLQRWRCAADFCQAGSQIG